VGSRRGCFRALLASTSVTALLIGGGAPQAFAACNTSYTNTTAAGCSNTATIIGIAINNSTINGTISNSGAISPNGIALRNGSTIGGTSGGIADSGTIGGGISIDRTSAVTSYTRTAISISDSAFSGGIGNAGTISSTFGNAIVVDNTATFEGGISNSGTISTPAIGFGNSDGNGIWIGGSASHTTLTISTFTGGISNSGTISAGSNGIWVGGIASHIAGTQSTTTVTVSTFSGGISNSGMISAAGGAGIWVGGNASVQGSLANIVSVGVLTFSGGISNSGTILVGGNGIWVGGIVSELSTAQQSNVTVTVATFSGGISNSGTISAGGVGIWVGGNASVGGLNHNTGTAALSTFAGGIGNSGTITAGGAGIWVGGEAISSGTNNVSTVTVSTFGGGISNSGTISAGGNGIWAGGDASIDNYSGGNTTAVTISNFAGGISNSGKISAGGAGIEVGGSASIGYGGLSNSASVTISTFAGGIANSGTIVARTGIVVNNVATFLGDIVNSGTITGTGGTAIDVSAAPNNMTIDITGGAISGNILGAGTTSGDTLNFGLGAGKTFTYNNSFENFQTVNIDSGTVVLNGAGNSATNVNVGVTAAGALAGTGSLNVTGAVTIDSGGALIPGSPTAPFGTFTITGNLAFDSGSGYGIQIAPGTGNNSKTDVNGTASLGGNGTVVVKPQLGYYAAGTDYQILTTTSALTGTFAGLTVNGDHTFAASLDYTTNSPNDVDLDITTSGYSLLTAPAGLNQNQQNVLNGINNAILQGDSIPTGFFNLGNLSGPTFINALTQLEGQPATGAETSAFQLMTEFLNLLTDPSSGGGANPTGGGAPGFAPEQDASLPSDIAQAYASILSKAPPQQQTFDQRWSAWGAAFGGAGKLDGDPSVGSNSVTASDYGYAAGMDYHATPNSVYGFALSGGGTNWSVAQNLGSGRSDSFQLGVHDTTHWGPVYLTGALAFANHWFTTNRTAVGDQLQAKFDGQSYAVRGEAGYRYALPVTSAIIGVTPYAALQVQDFHTRGFSETDLTGGGLGLSFAAQNATDTRSELGARFDNLQVVDGMPLVLRARVAWAHDWVSNPSLGAVFQALPGSNFTVNGAAVPENSALTTAAAELHINAAWTAIAKFDGEFAETAQTYAGTGTLRYSW
jgi:uncharacterized protein with beta-barrel porin domain